MPDKADLLAALDAALRAVDRAIAGGMRTRTGEPARPALETLRVELVTARQAAMARDRAADRDWVSEAIRAVAEWTPEDDVELIAALGRIARALNAAAASPGTAR